MEDLGKVIANLDRVAARAYAKLFNKSLFLNKLTCTTALVSEQAPNPDSRITLSTERDRLGLNRVQLDWRAQSTSTLFSDRSR